MPWIPPSVTALPHSLTLFPYSPINVTLGAHNINKPEKTWQVIPVKEAIPHPEYNRKDYSNDIMLLQVGLLPCSRSPTSSFCSHFALPLAFFRTDQLDQFQCLRRWERRGGPMMGSRPR